jgi:hypothetical protein
MLLQTKGERGRVGGQRKHGANVYQLRGERGKVGGQRKQE